MQLGSMHHLPSTSLCISSLPPHFTVFIISRRKPKEKKEERKKDARERGTGVNTRAAGNSWPAAAGWKRERGYKMKATQPTALSTISLDQ